VVAKTTLAFALVFVACGNDVPVYQGPDFNSDPTPPGPMNGRIVTTNNGDDTLSVVDPGSARVLWRIPVGFIPVELEGPHHVSADPLGQFFFVNLSEAVVGSGSGPHGQHGSGTQPGYTLKLDAQNGVLAGYATVDPNPGDNTISADGKTLYVTHYDLLKWALGARLGDFRMGDSTLAIIDTATMNVRMKVPICPAAHGLRLSADGMTAYATCGPDEIAVVSTQTFAVQRVLLPGIPQESSSCEHCPYALGVAPDGTVWVSSLGLAGGGMGGGGVDIYNPATGAFDPTKAISYSGRAVFASFTHSATPYKAYVPEQGFIDRVHVYQGGQEMGAISPTHDQCFNAHMVIVSDDDRWGYLICEGDHAGPGTFALLDLQALSVVNFAPLGVFPDGEGYIPSR
jgi:YVTN family beta-propeller protein